MNLFVHRPVTLGILVVASFLSACAAPPRTATDDAKIRAVAVLSMLDEQAPVRRIGLTVFNNKDATADQAGALGKAAVGAAERRLAGARPAWAFRDATAETAALRAKHLTPRGQWAPNQKQLTEDLAQIANRLDADALFLIEGQSYDNMPGYGVGIIGRTLSLSSIKTATVHGFVRIHLFGRDGQQINGRGAVPFSQVPAADLGLTYGLDTLDDPSVKERVGRALQAEAEKAVNETLQRLGY